jgi:hypothetical protein
MKSDMAVYLGLSHFVDETAEQTSMLPAFQLATPEQGQGWLTAYFANSTSRIEATTSSGS